MGSGPPKRLSRIARSRALIVDRRHAAQPRQSPGARCPTRHDRRGQTVRWPRRRERAKGRGASGQATTAPPQTLRERMLGQLSGLSRYFFGFISSTISVMAGLVLIIVLSIYIGADPDSITTG